MIGRFNFTTDAMFILILFFTGFVVLLIIFGLIKDWRDSKEYVVESRDAKVE